MLITFVILSAVTISARAQLDAFALQQGNNYAPKPTITPDLVKYFELDGHARELVDTLIGPRPGGFFPEKTYEVAAAPRVYSAGGTTPAPTGLEAVGRAVERFLSGPPAPEPGNNAVSGQDFQFPPGFNQGFSLNNGNTPLAYFQQNNKPASANVEEKAYNTSSSPLSDGKPKSSISGIPSDYPKLPKFPFSAFANGGAGTGGGADAVVRHREPVVLDNAPHVPRFAARPQVPEGGLGPAAAESNIRRHPASVSEAAFSSHLSSNGLSSTAADASEYGTLTDETRAPGGLIGTIMDLFGLNKEGKPSDANGIGKAMTNLLGGSNSPLPAKNMISNVLYKALTSGSIQSNSSDIPPFADIASANGTITLTPVQQAAINENLEMIQNLIVQPTSPLCNPKPVPVTEFNIDAFMGQWYQVVYSPPLTQSACSVVSYKKLSDVNHGGSGSIFEVFEYTTDGMPYTRPKITSGYAILRHPGELIFRTTANQDDVNVHVIFTGPINTNGEYDFVILSTNCNYPIYVFARDPIVYKQRYETAVMGILERNGIVNGFSKLLNIVAPVDASTCTFPPTLFNNNNNVHN